MEEKEIKSTCEVHHDEPVFEHWGRYYCSRCKQWRDIIL